MRRFFSFLCVLWLSMRIILASVDALAAVAARAPLLAVLDERDSTRATIRITDLRWRNAITLPYLVGSVPPSLDWSQDGRSLYYTEISGTSADIFRFDLDTMQLHNLTKRDGYEYHAAASPDDRWLVYWQPHALAVMLLDTTTGEHQRIAHSTDRMVIERGTKIASWSPDGDAFVYFFHNGANQNMVIHDLATGRDESITAGEWAAYDPRWLGDGIAYYSLTHQQIRLFDVTTEQRSTLLATSLYTPIALSEDQTSIIYNRRVRDDVHQRTQIDLFRSPATGKNRTETPFAVSDEHERLIAWVEDEQTVLFSRGNRIFRYDLEDEHTRAVAELPPNATFALWWPNG